MNVRSTILFIISRNELYGYMPIGNGNDSAQLVELQLASLLQSCKYLNELFEYKKEHWMDRLGNQCVLVHEGEKIPIEEFEEKLLIAYGKLFRDGWSIKGHFIAKAVVVDYEIRDIVVSMNGLPLQTEGV
jgi:hypothetical protein